MKLFKKKKKQAYSCPYCGFTYTGTQEYMGHIILFDVKSIGCHKCINEAMKWATKKMQEEK